MRLLVTGGAGFIGSHVVEHAQQAGLEVAVLDDFSSGKPSNVPAGVPVFRCDLRDRALVASVLSEFRPELVSHQAAQVSVSASVKDPRFDAEVNILGGINLLDACTAPQSSVKRLVFASTGGAIYGEVPEGQRASEQQVPVPKSPYGISKLCFENLLRVYGEQRGLESRVLRYSNVYGPRQDPHGEAGVVAIFFAAALAGRRLTVRARRTPGDGGCIRDYVFVADAARANLRALQGELAEPLLNVGTGEPTSTQTIVDLIVELTGSKSQVEQGELRPGDVERSLLDVTRFERAFGAPTSLADGLRLTADWYRER